MAISGISNDVLQHIFGYVGDKQYIFVAGTSSSFRQVYLDTFRNEMLTSIKCAVASVSCAAVYLHWEEPGCDSRARSLFKTAAIEGKLEILKWGEHSGYKLNTILDCDIMVQAALHGHLEVMKYLRQLGISWNERTCAMAAKNGHLELLKWARANQCPWDAWTCAYAAMNGHLELLKWARANQCPWDEWTCALAATNGHLELLKWARSNGCRWNKQT